MNGAGQRNLAQGRRPGNGSYTGQDNDMNFINGGNNGAGRNAAGGGDDTNAAKSLQKTNNNSEDVGGTLNS